MMKYYDIVSQYDVDRFLEPFTECASTLKRSRSVASTCSDSTLRLKAEKTEGLENKTVCMYSMHGRVIVDIMYEYCHSSSHVDCTI